MAWIITNDSHTGVGMGGLAFAVSLVCLALIAVVMGAAMIAFRSTRDWGAILLAGGAGTITGAIVVAFLNT